MTLPNFDIRSTDSFSKSAGTETITFAPIVPRELKRQWEAYAFQQQGWIREDLDYRGQNEVDPGSIPKRIYSAIEGDDFEGNFTIPLWQLGPVPTDASVCLL